MHRFKQLELLTSLRFFAAAWVFFDHFGKDLLSGLPVFLSCVVPHGRMAVTFFFILSGFVLAYSNSSNGVLKKSTSGFLLARFARIYPIYFFAVLIPLPHKLWELFHTPGAINQFYPLPLVLTLTQSWIPNLACAWNPPAWSLSVEALFYLSFPLIFSLTSRFRIQSVLIGSVVLVMGSEFLRGNMLGNYPQVAAFFPICHLPQFILGVALGKFFLESAGPLPLGIKSLGVFLSMIYAGLFFYTDATVCWILPIVAVGFGGVILSAANLSGEGLKLLQGPLPILLGEASYGFYITHLPVMIGFQRLAEHFGVPLANRSMAVLLSGFLFCTAFSILIHLMIEKPARGWILSRCRPVNS